MENPFSPADSTQLRREYTAVLEYSVVLVAPLLPIQLANTSNVELGFSGD